MLMRASTCTSAEIRFRNLSEKSGPPLPLPFGESGKRADGGAVPSDAAGVEFFGHEVHREGFKRKGKVSGGSAGLQPCEKLRRKPASTLPKAGVKAKPQRLYILPLFLPLHLCSSLNIPSLSQPAKPDSPPALRDRHPPPKSANYTHSRASRDAHARSSL